MKKITTVFVLLALAYNVHAQNVGVGTKAPLANLEVQGNLLVQQPLLLTNTLPTIAQTYTMVNGSTTSTNVADSTGRIYDPSGIANYIPNLQSTITVQNNNATGVQITLEDMDLNTGDSLIIVNTSTGIRLLAVGNIYSSLATYNFNNTTSIQLLFKSNADANVGRGFQILYKFIFFVTTAPRVDNGNGNHLYYNPQTGLKLVTGAEGKGKSLISDSAGNATWKYIDRLSLLADADSNTTVEVERTPNDNIVRLTTGGTDHTWFRKNNTGAYPLINFPANGSSNFLLGTQSGWNLKTNTIGNTFIGIKAGFTDTTGNYNSFIGDSTGLAAIGNRNIAIGSGALYNNKSDANIAVGSGALANNIANDFYAGGQIAIGDSALYNSTSYFNTSVGTKALYNSTTGAANTANGFNSLYNNTTGAVNTANGYNSLYNNTTGSDNTGNGRESLYRNTTGGYNTANGGLSLNNNTTGDFNTGNGLYALYSNTTGKYNTALGSYANVSLPNLEYATAIGAEATVGASYSLVLGRVNSGFPTKVGIGTTTPTESLDVEGGIRTKYSGSQVKTVPGGTSTIVLTMPILPLSWDFTNTMILVSNVDGQSGTIYQAKLLPNGTLQVYFTSNSATASLARFNYIIFKL
jgi:hypothetical protein